MNETMMNDHAVSIEEPEEEIETSPIDLENIESTPNRLAVVIDDHLDWKVFRKHDLPSFDFLRKRYESFLLDNESKARDFKDICDLLTNKMRVISGRLGWITRSKTLSEESQKEERTRLKYELGQIKRYKERLLFMKDHFGIKDNRIKGSGIFFYKVINQLKKRLSLVWGKIESRNDNPEVINEFVEIMDEMLKQGVIDLKTLKNIYEGLKIS